MKHPCSQTNIFIFPMHRSWFACIRIFPRLATLCSIMCLFFLCVPIGPLLRIQNPTRWNFVRSSPSLLHRSNGNALSLGFKTSSHSDHFHSSDVAIDIITTNTLQFASSTLQNASCSQRPVERGRFGSTWNCIGRCTECLTRMQRVVAPVCSPFHFLWL